MKLSKEEKAAQKAAFHALRPAKKAEYIWNYGKWQILLTLVALIILVTFLHRQLTQKEPVLYLALANVSVSSDFEQALTDSFLKASGADIKRQNVYLYRDLYLSDDADTLNHEYAYASRIKVMGAIQAKRLDAVIMNREAYDWFSQKGYLIEPSSLEDPDSTGLMDRLSPYLTENEVILSDNSLEVLLGEEKAENIVTVSVPNALKLTSLPLFQSAGFDGDLYLGFIANSDRKEELLQYTDYLFP